MCVCGGGGVEFTGSVSPGFMEMQLEISNYSETEHQLYENKFQNTDSLQLVRHWSRMRADGRTDYYRDACTTTRQNIPQSPPDLTQKVQHLERKKKRSDKKPRRKKKKTKKKTTDLVKCQKSEREAGPIRAARNAGIFSKNFN